ncbi:MAG TPA: hypothetical protein VGN00_12975 [Puia sp.]|jgi:hypothetical protein
MTEENQPQGAVPQNQPDAGSPAAKKENKEDGDKLKIWEKAVAGSLLIFFTLFAMTLIVAYWPDRLPQSKEGLKPLYVRQLWHVRLACIKDTCCCVDSVLVETEKTRPPATTAVDTTGKKDSATIKSDTTKKTTQKTSSAALTAGTPKTRSGRDLQVTSLIDLNVLMLILVGLGGFLGNMIHIATSFTAFVGAKTFKRSWFLWYFVKPFTAAALAMGLYFVFRAGFLNYSADPAGINLYGVMTVAILAGLFTDRATLKLGEVFEVVFSIKKDGSRPDPLVPPHFRFDKPPSPDKLSKTGVNTIVITGDDLDKGRLSFTMGGKALPDSAVTRILTKITIQYTVPADLAGPKVKLVITDEQKKELYAFEFDIV